MRVQLFSKSEKLGTDIQCIRENATHFIFIPENYLTFSIALRIKWENGYREEDKEEEIKC